MHTIRHYCWLWFAWIASDGFSRWNAVHCKFDAIQKNTQSNASEWEYNESHWKEKIDARKAQNTRLINIHVEQMNGNCNPLVGRIANEVCSYGFDWSYESRSIISYAKTVCNSNHTRIALLSTSLFLQSCQQFFFYASASFLLLLYIHEYIDAIGEFFVSFHSFACFQPFALDPITSNDRTFEATIKWITQFSRSHQVLLWST